MENDRRAGLVHIRPHWLCTAGVFAAAISAGCGSVTVEGEPGGAGAGGTATTTSTTTTQPPKQLPWLYGDVVLAVRTLNFGEFTKDNKPLPSTLALGFNLDGLESTATSTDLCQPTYKATAEELYPDGPGGIDNSFGARFLPPFLLAEPNFMENAAEKGEAGQNVWIFRVHAPKAGQELSPLHTDVLVGDYPWNEAPAWDGTDLFPVRSDYLEDGDIDAPLRVLPSGMLVEGPSGEATWLSGEPMDVPLPLPFGQYDLEVTLRSARITMTFSETPQGLTAKGILGGVLDTTQLIYWFTEVMGADQPPPECPPPPGQGGWMSGAIGTADILSVGPGQPLQDPTLPCNGISIGIAFEAESVKLGEVVEPGTSVDPCAP
ncbi:MAG: hypothetical protein R3F14_38780 [Polyangiaceae bacterium]